MKKNLILTSLILMLTLLVSAQQSCEKLPNENRYSKRAEMRELSNEEKEIVIEILTKYNPNKLDTETAKKIHSEFRNAGLRAGPGMANTIKQAGFDPQELRKLDPPPKRYRRNKPYNNREGSHFTNNNKNDNKNINSDENLNENDFLEQYFGNDDE